MTKLISNPRTTPTSTGYTAHGYKYKKKLVERGIFNPIPVVFNITKDDEPMYSRPSAKVELAICAHITRDRDAYDYLWIFKDHDNPLLEDIEDLISEMMTLTKLTEDFRL
jgi:hypothetical protein